MRQLFMYRSCTSSTANKAQCRAQVLQQPSTKHASFIRGLTSPASNQIKHVGDRKENYWDGNRRLSSIAGEDDGGGRAGKYEESRAPLEDSDHLAVHCVHIFMQNLYNYATQNTVIVGSPWVAELGPPSMVGSTTIFLGIANK